jgi:hypothetical protein
MAAEYQLLSQPDIVLRAADQAYILFDEGNSDYQRYLSWLAGGGVPDPASPTFDPVLDMGGTTKEIIGS